MALKWFSRPLHLLGEVLIGLAAVLAVCLCALVWRLSRGPVDITWLVQREHKLAERAGLHVSAGRVTLAWGGFSHAGQPLEVMLRDVDVRRADLHVAVRQAGVGLSLGSLLVGQIMLRHVAVDGVDGEVSVGSLAPSPAAASPVAMPKFLRKLDRVQVSDTRVRLHGVLAGHDVDLAKLSVDGSRTADGGFTGRAAMAAMAGGAQLSLTLQASPAAGGATMVAFTTGDIDPASLAMLSPQTLALEALDLPLRAQGTALLDTSLQPISGHLAAAGGAGMLRAGQGSVAIASLAATLTADRTHGQLDGLRIVMARPEGAGVSDAPPPVITGHATATREAGRMSARFEVAIASADMGDLPVYWPEGTGGGARDWLTQNVPHGRAHDATVSGTLEGPADLSDVALTALSGGLQADDLTVYWLRPIEPLLHAQARVTLEGPDSLRVVMSRGGQDNLTLQPGASIRITGLSTPHQFGDIDMSLAGALPDALGLLNHPRLQLLSRSGLDVEGATGAVTAHLKMHIPLEDDVTMEQIVIGASAELQDVHLGRIAGGRDLDHGRIHLQIDGDGLTAAGNGEVATIPAALKLAMDFRAGPPGQVLQHVTAHGSATAAQLAAAGTPDAVTHLLAAGSAGLDVDYAGRRDGGASLQLEADLHAASVVTPLGWTKPAGAASGFGGVVKLDHGHVVGVEKLHAEGPGLLIASRAQVGRGGETLLLDRLEVGRTRAAGSVAFPADAKAKLRVDLHGSLLDLSAQLDKPKQSAPPVAHTGSPPDDETPGQPWGVTLAFDQVQLARGKLLAPLRVEAASDGRRLSRADIRAGAAGEIAGSIVKRGSGRAVRVSAADAGAALRALGLADNFDGGKLTLDGYYDDTRRFSPLSGTAQMENFSVLRAPAAGRLLQALTVYGLSDLARGPGLHFSRMVVPFSWRAHVLRLTSARAFSPSLGVTAHGDLDTWRRTINVDGTVVPAYFFNQLLGDLPLVGKLFSPEKGGGVFAARYSLRGSLDDPKVGFNPLSALTPGFLREGFGLLGK